MEWIRRVLVVQDDPDVREALAASLAGSGVRVEVASDGGEALDRLHAGPRPRVVLLDLQLPGLDGEALLGRIRADPRYADLPVITVTAGAGAPARGEVLANLRKPFDPEDLAAIVLSLCEDTAA